MSSPQLSPVLSPVDFSEDFAPLPLMKAKGVTEVDFDGFLSQPLRLLEDVKTGCGGQTWPAGMLLAKHMLRYHRDRLGSARMLVYSALSFLPGRILWPCCGLHASLA